jgi:hypothetical protein
MIDLYAERTAPGIFNEPFNTVTNLAFIVAAWAAWRYARNRQALTADIRLLISLVATIGVGSAIFHMFATRWALLLDVLPIVLFLLTYLWLYVRKVVGAPAVVAFGMVVLYFAATYAAFRMPIVFVRPAGYVPALVFLLLLGLYQLRWGKSERWLLLIAAGVFAVSLTLRSADYAAAEFLPMGSHFMWHILNGVTLYLTVRVLAGAGVECRMSNIE